MPIDGTLRHRSSVAATNIRDLIEMITSKFYQKIFLQVLYKTHNIKLLYEVFEHLITLAIGLGMEIAYEKYTTSNVSMPMYPYDYCSITHNDVNDFSTPGRPAFTIKNSEIIAIPKLDRLSEFDCKEICSTYECDPGSCTPRK